MNWAETGLTVKTVVLSVAAYAAPADSDICFGNIFTETEGFVAEAVCGASCVVEQSVRKG